MLADYHMHTVLCRHAYGTAEEYAAAAARKGLAEICGSWTESVGRGRGVDGVAGRATRGADGVCEASRPARALSLRDGEALREATDLGLRRA